MATRISTVVKRNIDLAYSITILDSLKELRLQADNAVIITDHTVQKLFGNALAATLKCELIAVPPGESSKDIHTFHQICRKMAELSCNRHATIMALGGGVVGDLAGFSAATFLRGISLIHIPTTLLAMVDSSIGGKTGINLPEGKNLIGAFHQPKEVVIPLDCLQTLPDRELRSGLSEVIKYGMIADSEFFCWLEENFDKLLNKDLAALRKAIVTCCQIKSSIVSRDERESNLRQILNYGHTIGHALEALTGYSRFTHGEAISLGMQIEGEIAVLQTGLQRSQLNRQNTLLQRLHPELSQPPFHEKDLLDAMKRDKKSIEGKIVFALPSTIGNMAMENQRYGIVVPQKVIHAALHSNHS
jgi:3-dehydroquinate synthase